MSFKRVGIMVAVLISAFATGIGWAAGQSPGVARDTRPTSPRPDLAWLSPEAAEIYKYVMPRQGELKWQQVPWMVNLPEAFRQARAENRPVLVWATDADPLGRC